jgi:uncharacterized UBP type Zn finger protein
MDNFKIYSYHEILKLENKTKKFIDNLPQILIVKYFGKSLNNYSDNKQSSPKDEVISQT